MIDRESMPKETVATGAAFRAGVKGMRYTENPDPEAAYETGRALRMIGHILDSQHSPVEHGRHVLAQLANAVLYFAMRGERQPWGADDTAFVFRETFKSAPQDALQQAQDAIVAYARKRPIVSPMPDAMPSFSNPVTAYGEEFSEAWDRTLRFNLELPPIRVQVQQDCIDVPKAKAVIIEYFDQHTPKELMGQIMGIYNALQPRLMQELGIPLLFHHRLV